MSESRTLYVKFSDAEISRQAEHGAAAQLRDHRYPALLLRFQKGRRRASWHVIRHVAGRSPSKKLGNWPDLTARDAIEQLPKAMARLTDDPAALLADSGWLTVADLLAWYVDRSSRDRGLSDKRRGTVRSVVACQLLPRLGSLRLVELNHDAVDSRLIWPMQEVRSAAYTRQAFGVLKVAFKLAARLKKLSANPVAGMVFSDFIDTPIRPKPCALRPQQLPDVLTSIIESWKAGYSERAVMGLLMLCHGTRITETRLAKWSNVDLAEGGEWFIPAPDAKTKTDHRLPITRQVRAILQAYRDRQKAAGYTGVYLFPRLDGKPLSEGQAQTVFEHLSAGEEWTSHDLRKIARSMWADLGVDYLIGELLLNHALDDLDTAYIHTHATALKRDALERWHCWLDTRGLSFFATDTQPAPTVQGIDLEANNGAA